MVHVGDHGRVSTNDICGRCYSKAIWGVNIGGKLHSLNIGNTTIRMHATLENFLREQL